jgi:hypothetical protein
MTPPVDRAATKDRNLEYPRFLDQHGGSVSLPPPSLLEVKQTVDEWIAAAGITEGKIFSAVVPSVYAK